MQRLTPTYRVTVAGKTPGGTFQDRLSEIKVTDKTGIKSDRVTLTFDNRAALLGLPPMGAEMQLWLGYKEDGLVYMGRYVIDKISASGPPRLLVLEGKAADMRSSLGAQKTRGWEGGTVGDLVTKIAGEHGLQAAVSPDLRALPVGRIDQADESDLHFLTRLAQRFDATAKPADGKLVFTRAGTGQNASGKPLNAVTITATDIKQWSVDWSLRDDHDAVDAQYHDVAAGELKTVSAPKLGTGTQGAPTVTLRQNFASEDAARAAAQADSAARNRARAEANFTVVGRPELTAESPITITGMEQGVSGTWLATEVTHTLTVGDGLITEIHCEPPGQKSGADDDYDPVAAAKR